jgi:hypothetical protein
LQLSLDKYRQEGGSATNVAGDRQKFSRHRRVFVRKPFQACANTVKLIGFIEKQLESHLCALSWG